MQASIIIPVWNGVAVLAQCLDAIQAHCGGELLEVMCVDNASADESAAVVVNYSKVHLIRQPVNLGFAGGVNAGLEVAQGDVLVLLNQDCIVKPGWLTALLQALETRPELGIVGCKIFNADGTLNHTGAILRRPEAIGVHLTDPGDGQIRRVEYVTGAAFALRRQAWEVVGRFDEGYYPGYFEECDYCYRARRKGIETAYVPEAQVIHLSSNRSWQADLIRHTANQHRARYRFVSKHFDALELSRFFEAEGAAAKTEQYLVQAAGRAMAARDTLRGLADILERRRAELSEAVSPALSRQLAVGYTLILHETYLRAEALAQEQVFPTSSGLFGLSEDSPQTEVGEQIARQRLQALQQREHDLLARLLFRPLRPTEPESTLRRWLRLLILRPLSAVSGRDGVLLAELHDVLEQRMEQLNRRLALLELLTRYDYR